MNEVKELVEELRNKKSRDNRDLLDKSADMIERLAKELCDKSGCHHKCHDTSDCVVEDEAKAIIGNNLPSTLKNEGKVSEKEKQIEKMAKVIAKADDTCLIETIVKALYNAGYRKQEWISVDERLPEANTQVLAINSDGEFYVATYIEHKISPSARGYMTWASGMYNGKPTHWMPLPEAPKMKGGE